MIWKPCILLAAQETGEDELGNSTVRYTSVKKTKARFTPWTDEEIQLEGREVTRNGQHFIIPIPFAGFPSCDAVIMDGKEQEIIEVIDLSPRYTCIKVKVYKE